MTRHQQSLEQLLVPTPALSAEAKRRERKLPAPKAPPTGYALKVYRCQLVEERTIAVKRLTVSTPAQCAAVVLDYIDSPDREVFVTLMLDRANTLLGVNTVAVGDHETVYVSARQVFKPALLVNADRIVVAHNHLNGVTKPSKADKRLTKILVAAGRALDVQVCDHLIVGRNAKEWFSMLDAGMVPEQ